MKEVSIQRDGLNLRGLLQESDNKDHIVILMHGFTGSIHSAFLDELVDDLADYHIASIRFDFNGHGQSDGCFTNMNVFNEIEDSIKIIEYVNTLGYQHISLLGHSQGGVVASMIAGYYPDMFNKLVLMAPAATLKDDALKGVCMDASYDPQHIPDTVEIHSHNVTNSVGGHYFRIAQTLPIYEVAQNYRGPVCLIHGDDDQVVNKIASERYHDIYNNSMLHFIHGDNHGLEIHTQDVLRIVLEFLSQ